MKNIYLILTVFTFLTVSAEVVPVKGDFIRKDPDSDPGQRSITWNVKCSPSNNTCFTITVPDPPPADPPSPESFNPNIIPVNVPTVVNQPITLTLIDGTIIQDGLCSEYLKTQDATQDVTHIFTYQLP